MSAAKDLEYFYPLLDLDKYGKLYPKASFSHNTDKINKKNRIGERCIQPSEWRTFRNSTREIIKAATISDSNKADVVVKFDTKADI
jgi:hypothetical protein